MRFVGVTGTQEVGSQSGRLPCQIDGETQFASDVTVQVSSSAQQTPCGGSGHGFGSQVTHSKCQISGARQVAYVATRHALLKEQHAPGGAGHGLGSQIKVSAVQVASTQPLA
jgi:hypothetical protein